jgi:hypothetical protein
LFLVFLRRCLEFAVDVEAVVVLADAMVAVVVEG